MTASSPAGSSRNIACGVTHPLPAAVQNLSQGVSRNDDHLNKSSGVGRGRSAIFQHVADAPQRRRVEHSAGRQCMRGTLCEVCHLFTVGGLLKSRRT